MDLIYMILPVLAWVIAGSTKFAINYFRFGQEAVGRIGNGGFPSSHTTIVSSAVVLVGLKLGFTSPIFSLAEAFLLITIIDAMGIRRSLGKHAKALNCLVDPSERLRESQGHSLVEVLGGLCLGAGIGYIGFLLG